MATLSPGSVSLKCSLYLLKGYEMSLRNELLSFSDMGPWKRSLDSEGSNNLYVFILLMPVRQEGSENAINRFHTMCIVQFLRQSNEINCAFLT